MATFFYKAYKQNNPSVKESGKIDADNITAARVLLRQKGLIPTELKAQTVNEKTVDRSITSENIFKKNSAGKVTTLTLNQKIDLTTTIHALLNAGVPIIEALLFIQNDVGNKKIQNVCFELKKSIISGATFSSAIAKYPKTFDKVYLGLVKAGEDSGEIEGTMGRLIDLLKKQQSIKSKVIGALMYPVFVILVAIVALIILLTFVFPKFEEMFNSLGGELPIPTVICMEAGKAISAYWYFIIIILAIFGLLIYYAFMYEPTRRIIDTYVLKVPLLSNLLVEANLSNFLSVLQVGYDAGIPIVECLRLAALTLDNFFLKDSVSKAIIKVQQGVHLSTALRSTNAFPSLIMFLLSAGEQSGQLGDMLTHCVTQIDKRLDDAIDRMTKLIEPIMLILMGGVVLFIALALYMPLFKTYTLL